MSVNGSETIKTWVRAGFVVTDVTIPDGNSSPSAVIDRTIQLAEIVKIAAKHFVKSTTHEFLDIGIVLLSEHKGGRTMRVVSLVKDEFGEFHVLSLTGNTRYINLKHKDFTAYSKGGYSATCFDYDSCKPISSSYDYEIKLREINQSLLKRHAGAPLYNPVWSEAVLSCATTGLSVTPAHNPAVHAVVASQAAPIESWSDGW